MGEAALTAPTLASDDADADDEQEHEDDDGAYDDALARADEEEDRVRDSPLAIWNSPHGHEALERAGELQDAYGYGHRGFEHNPQSQLTIEIATQCIRDELAQLKEKREALVNDLRARYQAAAAAIELLET